MPISIQKWYSNVIFLYIYILISIENVLSLVLSLSVHLLCDFLWYFLQLLLFLAGRGICKIFQF
jgi:hypothetical protein